MPILIIFLLIGGVIFFKIGYYHYLRGRGYKAEDSRIISQEIGVRHRDDLLQATLKRAKPTQRKRRDELIKGVVFMSVGILLISSSLFLIFSNYPTR